MKLLEKNTTMCNMKNVLDRINGKLDFVEKKVNKSEYETIENIRNSERKGNFFNEHGISELWENFKWPNIFVIGVLEKEEI